MSAPERNGGHDAWLDALADGEGYALVCPDSHGSLPPRRVCPECGADSLTAEPLAETGTVETRSVVHVAGPRFAADTPYVTAIADFGPVRLTGIVRGIDPAADAVAVGDRLTATVEERGGDGDSLVAFRPADDE